jgi:hypothetical protein
MIWRWIFRTIVYSIGFYFESVGFCSVLNALAIYNSPNPQYDVLFGGVSDFMSFEELTTSAKLVKVRL